MKPNRYNEVFSSYPINDPSCDVLIQLGWKDESSIGENMPCFTKGYVRFWVDFPREEQRSVKNAARFYVQFDEALPCDPDHSWVPVYTGDDFALALKYAEDEAKRKTREQAMWKLLLELYEERAGRGAAEKPLVAAIESEMNR